MKEVKAIFFHGSMDMVKISKDLKWLQKIARYFKISPGFNSKQLLDEFTESSKYLSSKKYLTSKKLVEIHWNLFTAFEFS